MTGNLLDIKTVEKEGKNWIEIKLKGALPGLWPRIAAVILVLFVLIFVGITYFILRTFSLPLLFRVGFLILLFILLAIFSLGLYQNKNQAVYLYKKGRKLYVKRVLPPWSYEEAVSLDKSTKLVLVKFMPKTTFNRFQLLLKGKNYLEPVTPKFKSYKLLEKYPIISPGTSMKKFLYVPKNARKIAKLLNIPLKVYDKNLEEYIKDLRK